MSITQNVSKNNVYILNLALSVPSIRMSLSCLHFYGHRHFHDLQFWYCIIAR